MILANLMGGFSVMLVCLVVQVAFAFWSVRYYIRQSFNAAAPHQFFVRIRPLLISMLAMMAGNFIQIALWGILFLLLGELDELYEAIYLCRQFRLACCVRSAPGDRVMRSSLYESGLGSIISWHAYRPGVAAA